MHSPQPTPRVTQPSEHKSSMCDYGIHAQPWVYPGQWESGRGPAYQFMVLPHFSIGEGIAGPCLSAEVTGLWSL